MSRKVYTVGAASKLLLRQYRWTINGRAGGDPARRRSYQLWSRESVFVWTTQSSHMLPNDRFYFDSIPPTAWRDDGRPYSAPQRRGRKIAASSLPRARDNTTWGTSCGDTRTEMSMSTSVAWRGCSVSTLSSVSTGMGDRFGQVYHLGL